MLLRSITLENIRGLGSERPLELTLNPVDGDLAGWHVVVGPNGSGKAKLPPSADVLQALRAVQQRQQ